MLRLMERRLLREQAASKAITYTPTADYNGADSFTVQVTDGALSDTITVDLTIDAVNDTPVITGNTAVVMSEDGDPTPFSLTLNVTNVDVGTMTWSIQSAASNGTAGASGTGLSSVITYDPTANYTGTDSFTVRATNGTTGLFDDHIVSVTINAVNDTPVITEGDGPILQTIDEDNNPTAFSLTLNATDTDLDTLTWSISSPATNGVATATGTGNSKVIGYTPTANYNGADSFIVQVFDGATSDTITVDLTINSVNDTPVITGNSAVVMSEDSSPTPFSLTLDVTNVDLGTMTWSLQSAASNGTAGASGTGSSQANHIYTCIELYGS